MSKTIKVSGEFIQGCLLKESECTIALDFAPTGLPTEEQVEINGRFPFHISARINYNDRTITYFRKELNDKY